MLGIHLDPAIIIAVAIFLLVGFPVHEFSHAFVAYRLGDGTAKMFGRLTLNPVVHFDPLGGGLLVLSAITSGIMIGWAKPTPVNPMNLRGRHGEAMVALAGPLSNFVMAAIAALLIRALVASGISLDPPMSLVGDVLGYFLIINITLAIFNLLPIPPLDGSKVLYTLLNPRTVWQIRPTLEQYGFIVLIVFVFTIGGPILGNLIYGIARFMVGV